MIWSQIKKPHDRPRNKHSRGNKSLTQGYCFSILCQIFSVAANSCNKYADVSIYLMQVLNHCSLMDNKSCNQKWRFSFLLDESRPLV